MQRFYIPEITGKTVILSPEESKHVLKVLRMTEGDKVQIIDGKGGIFSAEITEVHPKNCQLAILNAHQDAGKRDFHLHMAIAPTKNIVRFEWFLEKATELGIDEITPLLTEHSERKILKPGRLERILIAAMKQSQRAWLPQLHELTSFSAFIDNRTQNRKFIAHCNNGEKPHLKDLAAPGENVTILIGPEGDFSPAEVQVALDAGFEEISLGSARLRTETAGIAACHILNLLNESPIL